MTAYRLLRCDLIANELSPARCRLQCVWSKVRLYIGIFIILGLGAGSFPAAAHIGPWSYDAMACEPAGAPVRRDLHDSLAGKVRFREGRTGNIALICPIDGIYWFPGTGHVLPLKRLQLTYRDGDGRQGSATATAAVRRVRRSDGHVASLGSSSVSSNDSNAPNSGRTGWQTHQSSDIGHLLDLGDYYYYVQINLQRTDADVPLAVMGVKLIFGN